MLLIAVSAMHVNMDNAFDEYNRLKIVIMY